MFRSKSSIVRLTLRWAILIGVISSEYFRTEGRGLGPNGFPTVETLAYKPKRIANASNTAAFTMLSLVCTTILKETGPTLYAAVNLTSTRQILVVHPVYTTHNALFKPYA